MSCIQTLVGFHNGWLCGQVARCLEGFVYFLCDPCRGNEVRLVGSGLGRSVLFLLRLFITRVISLVYPKPFSVLQLLSTFYHPFSIQRNAIRWVSRYPRSFLLHRTKVHTRQSALYQSAPVFRKPTALFLCSGPRLSRIQVVTSLSVPTTHIHGGVIPPRSSLLSLLSS